MTRLSCSARNCDHNNDGICRASTILIEGISSTSSRDTYCSTYIDVDGEIGLSSGVEDSYLAGMMQGLSSDGYSIPMSPYVSCNATQCNYNFNGVCEARDVLVYGEQNGVLGTMCDTFIHK